VLASMERAQESTQEERGTQQDYRDDWQAANAEIRGLQMGLEDLIFELSEEQKADGVINAITRLNMRDARNRIDRKRAEIVRLEEDGTGATITSPVSGIVSSIDISPGNQTQSDTPLAVIEVVDRGYSLRFSVTAEQARRIAVGDVAEANRGGWGDEILAVLTSIRNDPQSPATHRILEFDVSGDVESGSQVNIILGQRGENFDVIVPNSALRQDTNGDFVLVVIARSSPLGNRFIATRADVNILATDDTSSAVVGALSGWDFVITASSTPIDPGSQVRLVDNP